MYIPVHRICQTVVLVQNDNDLAIATIPTLICCYVFSNLDKENIKDMLTQHTCVTVLGRN